MKVWIFSDLHFESSSDPLFSSFLSVLSQVENKDHLILNGDIFDLLVGSSEYFRSRFSAFFSSIERLSQKGTQIHYIEGNHDFHIQSLFPKSVRFYDEKIDLFLETPFGKKHLHVAHGDLIDPEDTGYLRLRALFRSGFIRNLAKVVPGAFIEWVGNLSGRRAAHEKVKDLPEYWSKQDRERLRELFRGYAEKKHRQGTDFIVLGHCHDLDEAPPFYFNMGYPPVHRQFLLFDSSVSSEKELLKRRNFSGI